MVYLYNNYMYNSSFSLFIRGHFKQKHLKNVSIFKATQKSYCNIYYFIHRYIKSWVVLLRKFARVFGATISSLDSTPTNQIKVLSLSNSVLQKATNWFFTFLIKPLSIHAEEKTPCFCWSLSLMEYIN